ncbi:MAG TPA: DUF5683 domain-containing protein [Ignavibacteriales bacterium]|nr:DUF5683 domain-containing protein [Ignavibacteriales bacterium]
MAKCIIKIFLFLLLMSAAGYSQTADTSNATTPAKKDTLVYRMHKSPLRAVLRSAILPGLGQIYNESYWKVPVVWGFLGYYGYEWVRQNNNYHTYATQYKDALAGLRQGNAESYKRVRDFYRDQRDLFAIYMGIAYALNLLDAYVDAQLFDFSVDEDPVSKVSRLNLRVNF